LYKTGSRELARGEYETLLNLDADLAEKLREEIGVKAMAPPKAVIVK
jgi:hypothetical protein